MKRRLWLALPAAVWIALGLAIRPSADARATDAGEYRAMVEESREALAPFAHRVAVPFIVRLIPLEPIETRFVVLTTCSTVAMLVLLSLLLERLGLPPPNVALAGALCVVTPGLAYLWENPFLTDAPWLLAQQTALTLVTLEWLLPAALVVVTGVLIRENAVPLSALLLTPGWFTRRRLAAGLLMLCGALVTLALIRWASQVKGLSFASQLERVSMNKGHGRVLGDALGQWHLLWAVTGLGLVAAWSAADRRLVGVAAVTLAPAVAACAIAINTQRMLAFGLPAVAWAVASEAGRLGSAGRRWWWAAVLPLAAGCIAGAPSAFGPQWKLGRIVFMAVGAAMVLAGLIQGRRTQGPSRRIELNS